MDAKTKMLGIVGPHCILTSPHLFDDHEVISFTVTPSTRRKERQDVSSSHLSLCSYPNFYHLQSLAAAVLGVGRHMTSSFLT